MEDASLQTTVRIDDHDVHLFGVFDGHGGDLASAFCRDQLPQLLTEEDEFFENTAGSLVNVIHNLEEEWLKEATATKNQKHDGSTVLLAVLYGKTLHVANLGDSEGLISRKGEPLVLTYVHNPSKNPSEVERITSEGGRIYKNRLAHPHLNSQFFNLGVSGAIGDVMYKIDEFTSGKPSALTTTAHVKSIEIDELEDDFLVLACDGLWDVFTYEECVEFVRRGLAESNDVDKVCADLVKEAEEVRESGDNITAMILTWKAFGEPL